MLKDIYPLYKGKEKGVRKYGTGADELFLDFGYAFNGIRSRVRCTSIAKGNLASDNGIQPCSNNE